MNPARTHTHTRAKRTDTEGNLKALQNESKVR